MPGKKEDKTTFVSEQWGLQLRIWNLQEIYL